MERRRKPLRRKNSIRTCFGNRERQEGGDEGWEAYRKRKGGGEWGQRARHRTPWWGEWPQGREETDSGIMTTETTRMKERSEEEKMWAKKNVTEISEEDVSATRVELWERRGSVDEKKKKRKERGHSNSRSVLLGGFDDLLYIHCAGENDENVAETGKALTT